jgi:hypothetical protein
MEKQNPQNESEDFALSDVWLRTLEEVRNTILKYEQ